MVIANFGFSALAGLLMFWVLGVMTTPEYVMRKLQGGAVAPQVARSHNAFERSTAALGYLVTAFNLNVRAGPSAEQPVRRVLSLGHTLNISERKGDWVRVGPRAWVSAKYIGRQRDYELLLMKTTMKISGYLRPVEIDILRPKANGGSFLGRYRYGRNDSFLFLRGARRGQEVVFTEVDKTNDITGYLTLSLNCINSVSGRLRQSLECKRIGAWISPNGDRRYRLQ